MDNRNRKQWKCQTIESTDWNSRENANIWRKDLADTINVANEQLGIAVHWEHRSFKEQAKEMLMLAKQKLHSAQYATYKSTQIKSTAVSREQCRQAGMEVMEMIAKVREPKSRLDLPIVSGKHLRKISDSNRKSNAAALDSQSADNAEKFITTRKIDSFESLAKFTADKEQRYQQLETVHLSKGQKLNRLKELSKMYALYAPIQATYKESQSLKGLAKIKYDKEHKDSLSKYPELKERMQSLLQNGEKIMPKQ